MKGFPNQVAELDKIGTAARALATLVDADKNARDDGIFGLALVRSGVAGTGHKPRPIEEYIREQLKKEPSNQSFRTTARGLRELFRLLRFIDDSGGRVQLTDLGRRAAAFAGKPLQGEHVEFWRKVLGSMTHRGSDEGTSHPYQVLLRLVARKPGITRAKCALALEARNDSPAELDRIAGLADLSEDTIREKIKVSESNWDNAKKVLPKFAEQLGDVIKTGQSYVLAGAPGLGKSDEAEVRIYLRQEAPRRLEAREPPPAQKERRATAPRAPRASREVTPDTIGRAGTAETFDEVEISPDIDPQAAQAAIKQRLDRLRRHNLIVKALAARLHQANARLREDPFDILVLIDDIGLLGEIKTLDGTAADERDRVQEALAQLLYYEAFVTAPVAGKAAITKIACFEGPIKTEHQKWLNSQGIVTIWQLRDGRFGGDALAAAALGRYIKELG